MSNFLGACLGRLSLSGPDPSAHRAARSSTPLSRRIGRLKPLVPSSAAKVIRCRLGVACEGYVSPAGQLRAFRWSAEAVAKRGVPTAGVASRQALTVDTTV